MKYIKSKVCGFLAILMLLSCLSVSENFADTLSGVIYAEGQFNSVPYLADAEPSQAQYEAIYRALNGSYVLPMDVVKFANYIVDDNVWGQIGGHYFFCR